MFTKKKIDDSGVNITTTFEIEEDRDCFYTLGVQDDFVYINYYEKENGESVLKDEVIIPSTIASVMARLITQEINKINNDIEMPYYTTVSTSTLNVLDSPSITVKGQNNGQ